MDKGLDGGGARRVVHASSRREDARLAVVGAFLVEEEVERLDAGASKRTCTVFAARSS